MTAGIRNLRGQYLFRLGRLCGGVIPGGDVNRLKLTDFANLIDSIDAYTAASTPGGGDI